MSNILYFVIITEQKKKEKFLSLLGEYEAHLVETVYAHGSLSPNIVMSLFGLETNQSKIMITCLLKQEKANELIEILYNKYKFSEPNTGIAFGIRVDGLAF